MEKWITEFGEWLERQWINYTGTCLDENRGREWAFNCARVKFAEMYAAANIAPPAESLHEMAKLMCGQYDDCAGCPLDGVDLHCVVGVYAAITDAQAEAQLTGLRAWGAANPPKTYKQDFLEKFPGARTDEYGTPKAWLQNVYTLSDTKRIEYRSMLDRGQWDKPLGYWEA